MAMRKVIRVVFRDGVNMPGDGVVRGEQKVRQLVGSSTETVVPPRGMVGSKWNYEIGFHDGLVIVTHPTSKISMRYPMAMVKEIMFADDVPEMKA